MQSRLDKVIEYLRKEQNCIVVKTDDSLQIFDMDKPQNKLYNKDLRLLNDLSVQFVQTNYPLFHKELFEIDERLIPTVFNIKVDESKVRNVKSFRQITKKKLITFPNGEVEVKNVIVRRKKLS